MLLHIISRAGWTELAHTIHVSDFQGRKEKDDVGNMINSTRRHHSHARMSFEWIHFYGTCPRLEQLDTSHCLLILCASTWRTLTPDNSSQSLCSRCWKHSSLPSMARLSRTWFIGLFWDKSRAKGEGGDSKMSNHFKNIVRATKKIHDAAMREVHVR